MYVFAYSCMEEEQKTCTFLNMCVSIDLYLHISFSFYTSPFPRRNILPITSLCVKSHLWCRLLMYLYGKDKIVCVCVCVGRKCNKPFLPRSRCHGKRIYLEGMISLEFNFIQHWGRENRRLKIHQRCLFYCMSSQFRIWRGIGPFKKRSTRFCPFLLRHCLREVCSSSLELVSPSWLFRDAM